MRLPVTGRLFGILFLTIAFAPVWGIGQNPGTTIVGVPAGASPSPNSSDTASSLPHDVRGGYAEATLVGVYRSDGKFKKTSKLVDSGAEDTRIEGLRPAEVPETIDLHPLEFVVENFEPPMHATKALIGHALPVCLLDDIVTFVYGREKSLQSPTHVTTDSMQRLIISDPDLPAIHILTPTGKNSFRIAVGPRRRLQVPAGVAVDGEDNIYVADSKSGLILVFDSQGRFVRKLGYHRGESSFQSPTGIAIDGNAKRLFVLDSTVHQLIILDLQGNVLRRVGDLRDPANGVHFDNPTEIALGKNEIVVLDADASRIQVLDLQGRPRTAFKIRNVNAQGAVAKMGLAVDDASHIYVSNLSNDIRIYDQEGQLLGSLERPTSMATFRQPSGMWIDSAGRIYVADTRNSRVQVFEVRHAASNHGSN